MTTSDSNRGLKPKDQRPIYAKKPSGVLLKYRQWFGYSLLAVFIIMPFIKVNGEQFLLFNIIERKFVIFGMVFWPQDLHIFVFGMLIFLVFIVLFTVVYGRVWCGWACPQTVFMELIFRKVELAPMRRIAADPASARTVAPAWRVFPLESSLHPVLS